MYLVVVDSKIKEPLSDLMPSLKLMFPETVFSIHGSPEKGYKLHVEGSADEIAPRKFATSFLQKWKASPKEEK